MYLTLAVEKLEKQFSIATYIISNHHLLKKKKKSLALHKNISLNFKNILAIRKGY